MKSNASISKGELALSPAQRRAWILQQLDSENVSQNIAAGVRWSGAIDSDILTAALRDVLERHEILRSEFGAERGEPLQRLSEESPRITLVDLDGEAEGELAARLSELETSESTNPFDLSHGPLLRLTDVRLSDSEHRLILVTHRIVCDRASARIVLSEILSSYNAHLKKREGESGKPIQYCDIVATEASSSELSFWTTQLASAPSSLDLPTDRPRPAVQTSSSAHQILRIDGPLVSHLRELGQREGATLFSTLLAGFTVLLHRYSRQDDMVVGTRVSGRNEQKIEHVVGPLENMLALRIPFAGERSFSDFLHQVRETVENAFSHQVPFESVLTALRLERDMTRHPLFQVMFEMRERNADFDSGTDERLFDIQNGSEPFDLSVEICERHHGIDFRFGYNADLFDDTTINRMTEHYRILLQAAAGDPNLSILQLPLISESERHRVLVEWNDTKVEYPRDVPLHKLIEEQVEKTPDGVALMFDAKRLTYRQVNDRANQLAAYLRSKGVGPDVLVGVCAERSVELVLALLASMKAGGAYVPLDPEYPKDRLVTMLEDAKPAVVLTQGHLRDRLPESAKNVFHLDEDWPLIEAERTENLPINVGGKNLAYAIYTSGSTGKPKGVPNVHEGIVNRLLWMQDMYKLTSKDRVLQKTPFSFDVSVWEFFWPLLTGATLVVARAGGHRDPAYLVDVIAEQGITTLHFVPSMLSIFLESGGLERCRSIRQVFVSGEALSSELQQRFFQRMPAELHNLYGPTEAAVDVTYWQCRPDDQRSFVPIGRPVANTHIYILDSKLQPTPIGVPGELHIGGIQVARGYLNRPELTAEKFIPDPFSDHAGARLYKTGDLARFQADGNIEYMGRTDFQVKLRGLRIELGEIESVLEKCGGVRQAVVVVREDSPGDKRLVAYLIAEGGQELQADHLRRELKDRIPEYMVPSRFVFVDGLPMTTSGKVDRKALPAPPLERTDHELVGPQNEIESKIALLFSRVLGLPSVGRTDNFFDLGGHSLLAAKLLARLHQETGQQIPLSTMFRGATVESLAKMLEADAEAHHDPVVLEIQHGDVDVPPFFAIVPPGEESLGYAMLARHMGGQQTVYKIQGHSPVTNGKRPYTEEEMQNLTREYIAAMRSVKPHGPYCLGGFCDGTHISEQIVLSLEGQGEEVGLFAIFDTWVLQHSQVRWLWKIYYYGQKLHQMRKQNFTERLSSYKRVAQNKVRSLGAAKPARTDWGRTYWPENFMTPRFQAPVILFKRPKQPFYYINDGEMGWGARTSGGVQIHEVDFPHMQILREPHVRIFGEKLAEAIRHVTFSARRERASHGSLATASTGQQNS